MGKVRDYLQVVVMAVVYGCSLALVIYVMDRKWVRMLIKVSGTEEVISNQLLLAVASLLAHALFGLIAELVAKCKSSETKRGRQWILLKKEWQKKRNVTFEVAKELIFAARDQMSQLQQLGQEDRCLAKRVLMFVLGEYREDRKAQTMFTTVLMETLYNGFVCFELMMQPEIGRNVEQKVARSLLSAIAGFVSCLTNGITIESAVLIATRFGVDDLLIRTVHFLDKCNDRDVIKYLHDLDLPGTQGDEDKEDKKEEMDDKKEEKQHKKEEKDGKKDDKKEEKQHKKEEKKYKV